MTKSSPMKLTRLIGNWIMVLGSPVWILPVILASIPRSDDLRDGLFGGKKWLL